LKRLADISKRLRKERELAFYGDIDFIPTEEYTSEDAKEAIRDTRIVTKAAKKLIQT
ncbi:MAG: HEPN domain-containing protein, partial [Candidatus Aminicenantes bacterium]|nr:HEPN domain-containing protein [Candidatus Aminicenantes bacterium]